MDPLAQLSGDITTGIILVIIGAVALATGYTIGQALRAWRLERQQAPPPAPVPPPMVPPAPQPPRPLVPGPLWQNSRVWEELLDRGIVLPPQPFTMPEDLPEFDARSKPNLQRDPGNNRNIIRRLGPDGEDNR